MLFVHFHCFRNYLQIFASIIGYVFNFGRDVKTWLLHMAFLPSLATFCTVFLQIVVGFFCFAFCRMSLNCGCGKDGHDLCRLAFCNKLFLMAANFYGINNCHTIEVNLANLIC